MSEYKRGKVDRGDELEDIEMVEVNHRPPPPRTKGKRVYVSGRQTLVDHVISVRKEEKLAGEEINAGLEL